MTEITDDEVRQSTRPYGLMTVRNGTVIQAASHVDGFLDEDTATHSDRHYGSTTALGGVVIQGDVQRLHIHFHNDSRTRCSLDSARGSDVRHRTGRDIERWLNEVLSSTATQMAETVAGDRSDEDEDTDDLSHRADRATSAAVTVVFAPQQHGEPAPANSRTLKLRQSSRHAAAPGAPGPGPPCSGPPGSDPGKPPIFNKDARHPFGPGDLLEVPGLRLDPYSVIVVRCASTHCYCLLVSTDRKAVPAQSCVLLYDASRHANLRHVDDSRARASLPVYMEPGDTLDPDSRVVPRALIVLPYASRVQMRGRLKEADLRTLVHVWSKSL